MNLSNISYKVSTRGPIAEGFSLATVPHRRMIGHSPDFTLSSVGRVRL